MPDTRLPLSSVLHHTSSLATRGGDALLARVRSARFRRQVPASRPDVLTVGDLGYGGFQIPADALNPDSVVLSAGAGTDTTFEALLVDRFGCRVHVLDPVPVAANHVAVAHAHEPRITFTQAALWVEDTTLTFHEPRVAGHVSHSATDLHGTPVSFVADARSIASLRAEHGWERIDLLKISAEGAEFAIVESVLDAGEPVGVICVEFAQPADLSRVNHSIGALRDAGYTAIASSVRAFAWRLTFERTAADVPG